MKLVLFAAALSLSGAAAAQMTPTPTPTNDRIVRTNVDDGSLPERDARGIPVISGPAVVPQGANQGAPAAAPGQQAMPAPNQAQVFATQPSTREYPPCTREMTDGCVQTYERGVRAPQ